MIKPEMPEIYLSVFRSFAVFENTRNPLRIAKSSKIMLPGINKTVPSTNVAPGKN